MQGERAAPGPALCRAGPARRDTLSFVNLLILLKLVSVQGYRTGDSAAVARRARHALLCNFSDFGKTCVSTGVCAQPFTTVQGTDLVKLVTVQGYVHNNLRQYRVLIW